MLWLPIWFMNCFSDADTPLQDNLSEEETDVFKTH